MKLKVFADNKINMTQFQIVFGWVENIVGKGENAYYQHCAMFSKGYLLGVGIVWYTVKKPAFI